MKKKIQDFDLKDKKVIIRVDFNVPIKDGIIKDDTRIKSALPTIKYAIDAGAKVILMSHLGRIKEESDLAKNDLKPVANRLSKLLDKNVLFIDKTRGKELENAINSLSSGDVVLMQNTRYEDLDGKKESSNDAELGAYWASLGEIFINDAFGTSHRAHASNVGIASHLPNGIGFLVETELNMIMPVIENPKRPFTVILGGAKVSDKIGVIKNLVKLADYILIGGGMSYTFLRASGINIGKSLLDEESIDFCTEVLKEYKDKIVLPIDAIVGNEITENSVSREVFINEIGHDDIGLDIGHKTISLFKQYIDMSNTIIWNGPVGVFEIEKYSNGTKSLLSLLSESNAITIIGGGDTASSAMNFGYGDKFTHISTGGGATLELLEGKVLPGIDVISDK